MATTATDDEGLDAAADADGSEVERATMETERRIELIRSDRQKERRTGAEVGGLCVCVCVCAKC